MNNPKERNAICLMSWWLDSAYCLLRALETFNKVDALFIDYWQRNIREKESAEKICALLWVALYCKKVPEWFLPSSYLTRAWWAGDFDKLIDRGWNKRPISSYVVPWRNYLFFSLAWLLWEELWAWDIVSGVHEMSWEPNRKVKDWCPDDRLCVANATAIAMSLAFDDDVRIHTPIMSMERSKVMSFFYKNDTYKEVLSLTRTCWQDTEKSCWECYVCKMRKHAFKEAGLEDLIPYEK